MRVIRKGQRLSTDSTEQGATAVEYAIMASLIAAVIVAVVGLVGVEVLGLFNDVISAWP